MSFMATRYTGADQIQGHERYAIEYGPILMAVTGDFNVEDCIRIINDPANPGLWLTPVPDRPLHFAIKDMPQYEYVPYYEIDEEQFTTHPIIDAG